ncbi:MAG: Dabb family protein [Verrucomicrobiota bacterium]
MVHHLVLYKLKPDVGEERLEDMIRKTRSQLLKVPEALSVRSGRRIEGEKEWGFFVAVDLESMDKLAAFQDDPVHVKFIEEVVKPNTTESLLVNYEMEPGRDIKYS